MQTILETGAIAAGSAFPPAAMRRPLHRRFEEMAEAGPGAIAVKARAGRLTYGELDQAANRVAAMLLARQGAGEGRVALLFEHGLDMIPALLGVLKAGKTYVPLDAGYPAERLRAMREDSGADLLLTNRGNAALASTLAGNAGVVLIEDAASVAPIPRGVEVDPDSPAYILYTSGSTGRPKGVAQTHANCIHHMRVWIDTLGIGPGDRLSLQSAYSWDSAVQDTFGALLSGAALHPVDVKGDGIQGTLDWMDSEGITVYHSTLPIFRSVARLMAGAPRLGSVRALALGGDPIHCSDVELFQRLFRPGSVLYNCYGATEASSALIDRIGSADSIDFNVMPLGHPVPGTVILLLDAEGSPIEGPEEGEIVLRSRYVAPGYWRDPAAAAGKFEPHPSGDGTVLYRTGDLGRRRPDGRIVLAGRKDFQVKIRGMRVELGEVEGALKRNPAVDDAVVAAREDASGDRYLAAYVVATPGTSPAVGALRAFLASVLPDHAVPSRWVFLDALPLTVNRKIDRLALPAPGTERPRLEVAYIAPDSELEATVAGIWREVLQIGNIGAEDNFFDLGGNSLRLANVNARLLKTLGRTLPMVEMYRLPTVRALARALAGDGVPSAAVGQARRRAAMRAARLGTAGR